MPVRTLILLCAALAIARAQLPPAIASVVNAADFKDASIFGLARGSIITIFGTNLSAEAGHVRVRLWSCSGAPAVVGEAMLLYVSPVQINAVLPATIPSSACSITVTNGTESTPRFISFNTGRFTAFTQNGSGFGPAVIQQYDAAGYPSLNRLTAPARPGAAMTLWGTGLGGADRTDVTVFLGSAAVMPLYAGPAPDLPGVDQINFVLPGNIPERCFVPVIVRTGSAVSGVTTVAVSKDGICQSEFGLSAEALAALDAGGVVKGAVFQFLSITNSATGGVSQNAEGWIAAYDASYLSELELAGETPPAGAPVICSPSEYTYSLHHPPTSPASHIYGLRPLTGASRAYITGFHPGAYPGAAESFVFVATLRGLQEISVSGTLPLPRAADTIAAFGASGGVRQPVAWWTIPSPAANDQVVLTAGSSFTISGAIFNGLTYVHQVSCAANPNDNPFPLPQPEASWALTMQSRQPVSMLLTNTVDQLPVLANSPFDFVLVRIQNSVSAAATLTP